MRSNAQAAGLSDLIYHYLETEDTEQKTDKKLLSEICSEAQMILTNTKQSQQFCQGGIQTLAFCRF